MKTLAALAVAVTLAACAPTRPLTAQEARDLNECRFLASTVPGFNLVNQAFNQEIALRNCLVARGY
jgi:hypothetical protein